jgi:hypothetical protein
MLTSTLNTEQLYLYIHKHSNNVNGAVLCYKVKVQIKRINNRELTKVLLMYQVKSNNGNND